MQTDKPQSTRKDRASLEYVYHLFQPNISQNQTAEGRSIDDFKYPRHLTGT